MASHGNTIEPLDENLRLGPAGNGIKFGALGLGALCLIIAVIFTFVIGGSDAARASHARFYHAYLTGFAYCLTIALAGLFFTMMQHMVKVGWSVNVRRVPEALAGTLPFLFILALPLLIPVLTQKGGELYPWAVPHVVEAHHGGEHAAGTSPRSVATLADTSEQATAHAIANDQVQYDGVTEPAGVHTVPAEHERAEGVEAPGLQATYNYMEYDSLTQLKQPWLTGWFFTLRIVFYFAVWTVLVAIFYGGSKRQDLTGDAAISVRLAVMAPVGIIAFALTLTFAAFDLLMSLDHHWFSTIFGVYVFAGGMVGMFATMVVAYNLLQRGGFLRESVTVEHYHDIGKYLFAFIFFWAYIGFSQFMLQWYASIPEETPWWDRRGVTSADLTHNTIGLISGFGGLSVVLLFGHFVIPFAFLMSRHIKRSREALLAGAVWMLVAHLVDVYWLVMPEYNNGQWILDLPVIVTIVGVIGVFVFLFVQMLGTANLRPIGDPRTPESLAFLNM